MQGNKRVPCEQNPRHVNKEYRQGHGRKDSTGVDGKERGKQEWSEAESKGKDAQEGRKGLAPEGKKGGDWLLD